MDELATLQAKWLEELESPADTYVNIPPEVREQLNRIEAMLKALTGA